MVETRKVQVTGGSTYTVSLPNNCATDYAVSAGRPLPFYPQRDSLSLPPLTAAERT